MSIFPKDMLSTPELTIESVASKLMYFEHQLQFLHWNTSSYAAHEALGCLYEYVHEFRDGVIEKLMGYTGKKPNTFKIEPISDHSPEAVVEELQKFSKKLKTWSSLNGYEDVEGLAQSLSGEAAKVSYLLTLT